MAWSPQVRLFVGIATGAVWKISQAETLLTGIPASGTGAILTDIPDGDPINLLVRRDDATSQGTYGIREASVQDRRLSLASAEVRGDAELSLRKNPYVSGSFVTSDTKVRSGRRVTISMAASWNISGTFTISKVRVYFDAERTLPQREVTFSNNASENDLYRLIRQIKEERGRAA